MTTQDQPEKDPKEKDFLDQSGEPGWIDLIGGDIFEMIQESAEPPVESLSESEFFPVPLETGGNSPDEEAYDMRGMYTELPTEPVSLDAPRVPGLEEVASYYTVMAAKAKGFRYSIFIDFDLIDILNDPIGASVADDFVDSLLSQIDSTFQGIYYTYATTRANFTKTNGDEVSGMTFIVSTPFDMPDEILKALICRAQIHAGAFKHTKFTKELIAFHPMSEGELLIEDYKSFKNSISGLDTLS